MSGPFEVALESPASLVGRIAQGDRGGEEELIGRYRRAVLAVLSGARRDPAAIDDLYQETFRIAIEKIRSGALREPEKLSGFPCGLARNQAIEHFRRAARHPESGAALRRLGGDRSLRLSTSRVMPSRTSGARRRER